MVSIPVIIKVTVVSLKGKAQFRCYPYPSNQYSISFHEEPEMEFNVDLTLKYRFKLSKTLVQKLEQFMNLQLRSTFVEQLVKPNRMYFRIPFTHEYPDENPNTLLTMSREDELTNSDDKIIPPKENQKEPPKEPPKEPLEEKFKTMKRHKITK